MWDILLTRLDGMAAQMPFHRPGAFLLVGFLSGALVATFVEPRYVVRLVLRRLLRR